MSLQTGKSFYVDGGGKSLTATRSQRHVEGADTVTSATSLLAETPDSDEAFPRLTADQLGVLKTCGGICPLLAVWGSGVRVPLAPPGEIRFQGPDFGAFDDNRDDNRDFFDDNRPDDSSPTCSNSPTALVRKGKAAMVVLVSVGVGGL